MKVKRTLHVARACGAIRVRVRTGRSYEAVRVLDLVQSLETCHLMCVHWSTFKTKQSSFCTLVKVDIFKKVQHSNNLDSNIEK